MRRPITLITGASAGIGNALARVFARHGHELVLVARRQQRLAEIADAIAAGGHKRPIVLPVDLARPDAADCIGDALTMLDVEPDIVVNNAGFGLVGAAAEINVAEQLAIIDLNVRALTDLSLFFLEPLQRRRGGILNVASVAGFLPGPGMAVYYATKAYVLSFSEALHRELAPRGVRVTTLCPGPVPSEFQERAGVRTERYPPFLTLSAERVAEEGYRGLHAGRRLVVPGFGNKLVTQLLRLTPRRWQLAAVDRRNRRHR
jgi:short-subunit dehydrogenase